MNKLKSKLSLALVLVFSVSIMCSSFSVLAETKAKSVVKSTTTTKKVVTKKATPKPTQKTVVKKATSKPAQKVNTEVEAGKVYNSFIVDAKWLSSNLNAKNLLILDARGPEAYTKGHIKGAIAVKWQWFANVNGKPGDKGWGLPLEASEISKKFAEYGVDSTKNIVVYADNKNGWGEDGRIVWLLRMMGLNNAKMLNGGYGLWTEKKYETSTDEVKPTTTKLSVAKLNFSFMATTDWLNSNLGKVKILDSRNKDEFEGATKFGEARGGHIPGAINLTFTNVFNADGTFKSLGELKKLFEAAGLKKDDVIVTYCTAGIRSAHLSLALRMAGYTKAQNYGSSFYGWAGDTTLKVEK